MTLRKAGAAHRAGEGSRHPTIRLLPSAVTVLALCSGLSAVRFALDGEPGLAYALVAAAAVLDALDGRIARLLDVESRIGAELDSLSDAVSFGVAPALVLYATLFEGSRAAWVVALVFAVSTVLRLARFNTLLDDDTAPPYAKEFFTGVPSPAGAVLALLPLAVTLQLGDGWWSRPPVVAVWMLAVAALVISRLPTLSLASLQVAPRFAGLVLVGVGGVFAALLVYPFVLAVVLSLGYLGHLPFAVRRQRWLAAHPEVWEEAPAVRKALRRRTSRRLDLGLRPPRVRRLAGRRR